jgi:hypothetical protein
MLNGVKALISDRLFHYVYGHAYMLCVMGVYEGRLPICLFCHARPGGGGWPCVHALLRYLLVLFDAKLYLKLPSNGSMTNWPQLGVCHSIIFPHTLFGAWEVWGASYTYMYFIHIWVH